MSSIFVTIDMIVNFVNFSSIPSSLLFLGDI
jgi:hypothetical protein